VKPCMFCEYLTWRECACGHACCEQCSPTSCPVCVRVKLFQAEQAMLRRLVPWQYVESPGQTIILSEHSYATVEVDLHTSQTDIDLEAVGIA